MEVRPDDGENAAYLHQEQICRTGVLLGAASHSTSPPPSPRSPSPRQPLGAHHQPTTAAAPLHRPTFRHRPARPPATGSKAAPSTATSSPPSSRPAAASSTHPTPARRLISTFDFPARHSLLPRRRPAASGPPTISSRQALTAARSTRTRVRRRHPQAERDRFATATDAPQPRRPPPDHFVAVTTGRPAGRHLRRRSTGQEPRRPHRTRRGSLSAQTPSHQVLKSKVNRIA